MIGGLNPASGIYKVPSGPAVYALDVCYVGV